MKVNGYSLEISVGLKFYKLRVKKKTMGFDITPDGFKCPPPLFILLLLLWGLGKLFPSLAKDFPNCKHG